MRDVNDRAYLVTIQSLAAQGLNVTNAALRILDDPGFAVVPPKSFLKVAQNYSLIYALFQMPDSAFTDPCIARLETEKNDTSKKSLILALWYTSTVKGDDAIKNAWLDPSSSIEVKEYANSLLKKTQQMILDTSSSKDIEDYDKLKRERQEIIGTISKKALAEFDQITLKIRAAFIRKK
jgi:hypothetical protein